MLSPSTSVYFSGPAGGRSLRARVPYVTRRAVSVSSILIISNTVSGLVGGAPLGVPEAFVDICFQKNTIISPARQRNPRSWPICFVDFECADGCCRHRFLPHVPCETLASSVAPLFSQREHDSESQILDLNFSILHRAFGAMNPMVRRTVGFTATKSCFKTT